MNDLWDIRDDLKERKKRNEEFVYVWEEFKNFSTKTTKHKLRHVPRNFDKIYNYLDNLMYVSNNVDFE